MSKMNGSYIFKYQDGGCGEVINNLLISANQRGNSSNVQYACALKHFNWSKWFVLEFKERFVHKPTGYRHDNECSSVSAFNRLV